MSSIVLHKIKVGCFVSTHRSHHGGWTAEGLRELTKRAIVFPNRKAIDWSGHFVIFFSQKSCSDEEIMFSNNMPILSFLQSSNYSAQHAACIRNTNARVQCDTSILLLCQSRPTINLFSNLTIWIARRPQANMVTIHQQTRTSYSCAKVCLDYGSPRMARARFDARANLTELIAWLGRWLLEKSGRSLAIDSSCSLLSNNVVSATFIRGLRLLLSSSTWTKWWQSYGIDLVLWSGYNWYWHPNFLSQHRNNKLPSHVEGVARNVAVWMGFS